MGAVGTNGYYWASSPYASAGTNAHCGGILYFHADNASPLEWTNRANAVPVRCVQASARNDCFLSYGLFDTLSIYRTIENSTSPTGSETERCHSEAEPKNRYCERNRFFVAPLLRMTIRFLIANCSVRRVRHLCGAVFYSYERQKRLIARSDAGHGLASARRVDSAIHCPR